jgi:hypothetical protein
MKMNRNLVAQKSRTLRLAVCALLSLALIFGPASAPLGGTDGHGSGIIAYADDIPGLVEVDFDPGWYEGAPEIPSVNLVYGNHTAHCPRYPTDRITSSADG